MWPNQDVARLASNPLFGRMPLLKLNNAPQDKQDGS